MRQNPQAYKEASQIIIQDSVLRRTFPPENDERAQQLSSSKWDTIQQQDYSDIMRPRVKN